MWSKLLCVSACWIVLSRHTGATPLDLDLNRIQRDVFCREGLEYRHGDLCCLYCQTGTYVKSHCTRSGGAGQCEECDSGTFIEHHNELTKCFPCTQCRSDQELVKQCTHAEDAKCQCRPGTFCHPDEACEVCKKCTRCKSDEEVARNCTSTTNTECKKIQNKPDAPADSTGQIVVSVLAAVFVCAILIITVAVCRRRRRRADSQRDAPEPMKNELQHSLVSEPASRRSSSNPLSRQLVGVKSLLGLEECERLCESLSSSASNSQHSLTPAAAPGHPDRREDEFPKLAPVKGEESLRACFEYFEDLNVDYYRRFFRSLGISDNVIKGCDHQQYEDRIHELLNKWVEKEGRDASLNSLLRALLDLSQKRTAEIIRDQALQAGHYEHQLQADTAERHDPSWMTPPTAGLS